MYTISANSTCKPNTVPFFTIREQRPGCVEPSDALNMAQRKTSNGILGYDQRWEESDLSDESDEYKQRQRNSSRQRGEVAVIA